MTVKILEKPMTYNDALQYVENHPKWRLPTYDEATTTIKHSKIHWIEDQKPKQVENAFIVKIYGSINGESNVNILRDVILVPRLIDTVIGNVFHVNGLSEKEYFITHVNKECVNEDNEQEVSAVNIMKPNDIVYVHATKNHATKSDK